MNHGYARIDGPRVPVAQHAAKRHWRVLGAMCEPESEWFEDLLKNCRAVFGVGGLNIVVVIV